MARVYQPKKLFDGSSNPRFKSDTRRGSRHVSRTRAGFVGTDGESITNELGHFYTMLCMSDAFGDSLYIENPDGLGTLECFGFMSHASQHYGAKFFVGFAFSYDVNMILKDLPWDRLMALWKSGKTWWEGYTIHYKPRREFVITKDGVSFRVWDVWGFFQSSFVDALEAYGHTDFLDEIAAMKQRRSEFTAADTPEMIQYCLRECQQLARMMDQFAEYLTETDLRLSRYDGAGAVAAAFLRRYGVKEHMSTTPRPLLIPAAHAYFGGRIEMVRFGHLPDAWVHQYDVRSAYPSMIYNLPCLACGEWRHDQTPELAEQRFTLYRIKWDFDDSATVCPFPWRDSDGMIFFPHTGHGWYWAPEVKAGFDAITAGVVSGQIQILERFVYTEQCGHRPFTWVKELYETRARWKREKIGAEKVLKLGLNSLYGKFAQRIGFKNNQPPTWHQLEWAGYVTSAARARIYSAAFPVILSGDLIAFATDAIFSTAAIDLPVSEELGAFEYSKHRGITAVQSGVYWCDNERVGHTRGFAKNDVTPDLIVAAWAEGLTELKCPVRRFVGLGRALTGSTQKKKWRTWCDEFKDLSLTPVGTKRILRVRGKLRPHLGLIPTFPTDPHTNYTVAISAPIKLPWLHMPGAFDADAARRDLIREDEADDAYD